MERIIKNTLLDYSYFSLFFSLRKDERKLFFFSQKKMSINSLQSCQKRKMTENYKKISYFSIYTSFQGFHTLIELSISLSNYLGFIPTKLLSFCKNNNFIYTSFQGFHTLIELSLSLSNYLGFIPTKLLNFFKNNNFIVHF